MSTRLTVLMPVYNAAVHLPAAIASILAQTLADFRFIIVDDGSTDASLAIIHDHAARDGRILVLTKPNSGITAALTFGLARIETAYTARMDADDIALPDRFARQIARFDADPGLAALGTRVQCIDGAGRPRHLRPVVTGPNAVAAALPFRNAINHPSSMIRTAVLRDAGGYREKFKLSQDYDLWLRLSERHRLDNLPEVLLHYRTYEGRASSAQNRVRQTTYSVAAAADFFCRRHGLPTSDATIDVAEPTAVAEALATLLAQDRLTASDRRALHRHALRFVRYGAPGAAKDRLARSLRRSFLTGRDYMGAIKMVVYSVARPRP